MQNLLTPLVVFAQADLPPKAGTNWGIIMPFVGIVVLIGVVGTLYLEAESVCPKFSLCWLLQRELLGSSLESAFSR